MVPDWLVKDPTASPVWEITGAEFSKADLHTAAGQSTNGLAFKRIFVSLFCGFSLNYILDFRLLDLTNAFDNGCENF